MAETEWLAKAYAQLVELTPGVVPDPIDGQSVLAEAMQETARKVEVVTQLVVDATRQQAHYKARTRATKAKASLLRKTAEWASAQQEYEDVHETLDGITAFVGAARIYRDNLRSSMKDLRAVARLMIDGLNDPNPGVPEFRPHPPPEPVAAPPPPPAVRFEEEPALPGMEALLGKE